MAILSTAKIVGMLASAKKTGRQVLNAAGEYVAEVVEDFMSGFAGYGWKIWEYVKGKWMLEIDSIRVREQFIVFEMLVSKMRAIIGSLGISQACGKIATVTLSEDGTEYLITLEDETMSFIAHDFMRCQTYTGTKQTFYHVEIASVVDDVIHVPVAEFDVDAEGIVVNPPEVGNDVVQFGNSVNKNRQSAIYIHADESGQPAIDIMFDIDSKDWTGKIKTRLGGDIPGGDGVRGFYCENGMIKGTDTSGHTVYCIHPDGTAEFGDGSAKFAADKSGKLAGGAISWVWDADKKKYVCTMGENVVIKWNNVNDIPGWLTDLDANKVQIGSNYMISPKLFTGKNTGTAEAPILTGIVQGDNCITIDGETKSGFYGIKENEIVFSIDSDTADISTVGDVIANAIKATGLNINDKFKVEKDGTISSTGSVFDGVYVEGFICSKFSTSFDIDEHDYPKTMNYIVNEGTQLNISLPNDDKYIGAIMTVYLNRTLSDEGMIVGGNITYNGNPTAVFIRNKGTLLRLMATHKVINNLYWEIINFDNRTFSLVNLITSGQNVPIIVDRSKASTPDKNLSNTGTLQDVVDYWNTI